MSYGSSSWMFWAPRKSSAERRADAARALHDAARRGKALSPVTVTGRKIAHTFWGNAWCDNLERYRDFAYRLERGRSYLRSGSVIDLRIEAGQIAAKVSGSSLYDVAIEIDAVARDAWRAIQRDCAGGIGSRLDLLAGRLSESVMARLCADRTGLFPAPSAIRFRCSCPDYASMCKHVAAAMYGVGARLDHAPELLFTLRRVSVDELLASAVSELPATPSAARVLADDGLAALFGIELAEATAPPAGKPAAAVPPPRTSRAAVAEPAPRTSKAAVAEPAPPNRRTRADTAARATAEPTRTPSSGAVAPTPPNRRTRAGTAARTAAEPAPSSEAVAPTPPNRRPRAGTAADPARTPSSGAVAPTPPNRRTRAGTAARAAADPARSSAQAAKRIQERMREIVAGLWKASALPALRPPRARSSASPRAAARVAVGPPRAPKRPR